jgi:histidine triad (HIT) family protein
MKDCLFCRIERKEIPSKLVFEDDLAIAFEDISPQAPTHILVIPRKHIPSTNEISPEDTPLLGHLLTEAGRIARERNVAKEGYRLVINCGPAAGQAVHHLHIHILGGRQMHWPPG